MAPLPPPKPNTLPFTTGQKALFTLFGFIAFYLSLLVFGPLLYNFAPDFLYSLGLPIIKGSPTLEYLAKLPSLIVFLLFLLLALKQTSFPLLGFFLALTSTPIYLVILIYFKLTHHPFG